MTTIPLDEERRNLWIEILGDKFRKKVVENESKTSYICSKHFPSFPNRRLPNELPIAQREEDVAVENRESGESLCAQVEKLNVKEDGDEMAKMMEIEMEMRRNVDEKDGDDKDENEPIFETEEAETQISTLDISPRCRICVKVLDGEIKPVPIDLKKLGHWVKVFGPNFFTNIQNLPGPHSPENLHRSPFLSCSASHSAMSLPPHAATHSRLVQFYRLRKEIADLRQNPRGYIKSFQKLHKNKEVYIFKVQGDGEIYGKSILTISVDVTLDYPFKTPILRFIHPLYHPNVDVATGEICSSLLTQENWKPETTIEDVLINVLCLLSEPDLSRPVNLEAANECILQKSQYLAKCKKLAAKLTS
ncbi:unnamed protein product [Caenorhabditis angaria]|uniref:UBC core domain-containing protein n=1 Tax=Caenorhabditis angaria TaxID=860376 RepID=A0A9P1IER0_9PELO|nr:unnamed protein product [Caenorhabditis angaria]